MRRPRKGRAWRASGQRAHPRRKGVIPVADGMERTDLTAHRSGVGWNEPVVSALLRKLLGIEDGKALFASDVEERLAEADLAVRSVAMLD